MKELVGVVLIFSLVMDYVQSQGLPSSNCFDVREYGAIGDGSTDDSQAFLKAWEAACEDISGSPVIVIPGGTTFMLQPIKFQGPCRSPSIVVQVLGNVVAPSGRKEWKGHDLDYWIMFAEIDGLNVNGNGQFDGQGTTWWHKSDSRPSALGFVNCNNLQLIGTRHINSAKSHMHINGCNGVVVDRLYFTAPADSPNTDGIDIAKSTNVHITGCTIATGDDCIAISGGSSSIEIEHVTCGPGHGISIGSLGEDGKTDTVEGLHVHDCSIQGTTNGLRIKTWQGGSGYARHMIFERISLEAVENPIIIDQFYCIHGSCKNQTSAVEISDITFNEITGTSATDKAVVLSCSQSVPCSNIILKNINIASANGEPTLGSCSNVEGTFMLSNPTINCLQQLPPDATQHQPDSTFGQPYATQYQPDSTPGQQSPFTIGPWYFSRGAQLAVHKTYVMFFLHIVFVFFGFLL